MADITLVKISALPAAEQIGAEDLLPVVQEGATKAIAYGVIKDDIANELAPDATLSEAGKAADAKAVGDALGLKADKTELTAEVSRIDAALNTKVNNTTYTAEVERIDDTIATKADAAATTAALATKANANEVTAALAAKQNVLTFDTTPTEGSGNPVTSAGVYASVSGVSSEVDAAEAEIDTVKSDLGTLEEAIIVTGEDAYVTGWSQGQINPVSGSSSSSPYRCRTSTFTFDESGTVEVTTLAGYYVILNQYNDIPSGQTFDAALLNEATGTQKVIVSKDKYYRWCVGKVDGSELPVADLPANVVKYVALTITDKTLTVEGKAADAAATGAAITALNSYIDGAKTNHAALIESVYGAVYDHLFIGRTGSKIVIPAESIYHVNISHSLGYKVIECHPQRTSDGHYFVHHLSSGKFANYFDSVDSTDISGVKASEVTWQWIVDNVRYKSTVPKYRTRPTTLEEFLHGCKENCLIPLMKFDYADVKELTINILGKNNYIVYGGTRETEGDAVIFQWGSHNTAEEILAFCNSIGKPLIYGNSKFAGTFTDEEVKAVVELLHANGYLVASSYEGNDYWRKQRTLGIDMCGGTRTLNRLVSGNTYNIETIFDTSEFTVTGGTVADNIITLEEGGTITCANIDNTKKQLAHVDLTVDFDGILTLTGGLGEFLGDIEFNSADGKLIICTAAINSKVNFTLTAGEGGTVIKDIKYKVGLC